MRALIVAPRLSGRGGMEEVFSNTQKELDGARIQCKFLILGRPQYSDWLDNINAKVYDIQKPVKRFQMKPKYPLYLGAIALQIRVWKPDVVLCTDPYLVRLVRFAVNVRISPKVVIVSWLHSSPTNYDDFGNVSYADAHLAISEGILEALETRNFGSQTILVQNPGNFACDTAKEQEMSMGQCDLVESKFIFVGRLNNDPKRIDVLLEGFARVKDREWTLDIYGDGPDKTHMMKLATHLGIQPKITWHGWVPNVWANLDKVTALILTSDYEGLSLVILEAMSRGIPVISSDCPVGPERIVREKENGLFFHRGDPVSLGNVLLAILEGSVALPTSSQVLNSYIHFHGGISMAHALRSLVV